MRLTKGVHHIAIAANGLEKYRETLKFYTEVLGMPVYCTWGTEECPSAMIDIGGGSKMELFSNGDGKCDKGALLHLAFDVEDTDACAKAVKEAGYEITVQPQDITIKADKPIDCKIAFCIGPVGEVIEFFEVK